MRKEARAKKALERDWQLLLLCIIPIWPLIKNNLGLSFLQILLGFPIPILLAIMLNQAKNQKFRKFVQSVAYCPHFISIVVLTGMLYIFLSPRNGIINNVIQMLGGEPIFFLGDAKYFKTTFVISGIWQNAGWSAIIYIGRKKPFGAPGFYFGVWRDQQQLWHKKL